MRKFASVYKKEVRFVKDTYEELSDKNIEILIDCENRKRRRKIIRLIRGDIDKYHIKLYHILSGKYNRNHYKKVFGSITEIVFTKGGRNSRIYCKEFSENGKKVVMILEIDKDFQEIKEKKQLEKLLREADKSYEYNFDEREQEK